MRRSAVWVLVCALGAALPLGCGDGTETSAPSTTSALTPAAVTPVPDSSGKTSSSAAPASAGTAGLASALSAAVERGDAPGVVGLVVDRNGVLFEGAAGQLDVANGVAMPVDAIFNIASMTKPVTSVAVMMLFERGLLDLDDPVSAFLPGFDALEVLTSLDPLETAPATSVMTIRHLLSHTSGIGYAFANPSVAQLQQGTQAAEWELPLLAEPGSEWNYSASTRVLGLIVEELTGEPLADFLQAEIFAPLGMVDTSYAVPAEDQARLPTLHRRVGGSLEEGPQAAPAVPAPPFNGDGGLYSTARDYGQFMRMFLNGGALGDVSILSESTVAQMGENQIGAIFVEQQPGANPTLTRPFPLGAGVDKFGLGFQITGTDGGGVTRSAGSLAWAGLFNTEFWIDPQRGIAATLLMQVLPFYDEGALRALSDFETAVYRDLSPSRELTPRASSNTFGGTGSASR
jgi:methyl acetate hydrolase